MQTKQDLHKAGFKPVPGFAALFINRAGQVFDYKAKRYLSPRPQNRVIHAGKVLSVPKLILSAFDKQPYCNNKQIRYIDGDKNNLQVTNLCYPVNKSELKINYADLYTAVRCYFPVPKRYKVADRLRTRMYLPIIAAKRCFVGCNSDNKGIRIFETYIDNPLLTIQGVAQRHALPAVLCTEIVNMLIKKMIREILTDLEAGELQILDFKPRRRTTAEVLKSYNDSLKQYGRAPIKIPRKKSAKQILKEWELKLKSERENANKSVTDLKQ